MNLEMLVTVLAIVNVLVVALLGLVLKNQLSIGSSMARIDERLKHIPTFREMQEADREAGHATYSEAAKDLATVEGQVDKLATRVQEIDRRTA